MRTRHPLALLAFTSLVVVVAGAIAPASASDDIGITRAEFALYMRAQEALADEAIQPLPEDRQMAAVVRKLKASASAVQAAIEKGKAVEETLADRLETDIRTRIQTTPLASTIEELRVQTDHAHIVVIIKWKNKMDRKLEEEASLLAAAVHDGGHDLVGTLSLWAVSPAGRKVFEAKIGFEAMSRIQASRAAMFAKKRYIKLFEDVWFLQPIRG